MKSTGDDIPRRVRIDQMTPAESAIRQATLVVEEAGAHPHLTDAVVLLSQAREKVADFVDNVPESPRSARSWTDVLAEMRAAGWTVAVHNDYRADRSNAVYRYPHDKFGNCTECGGGEEGGIQHTPDCPTRRRTFWLLVDRDGWCVKGEGRTDQEAFDEIAAKVSLKPTWQQRAETAERELAMVDEALARRPALADAPDRYTAIWRACDAVGKADMVGLPDAERKAIEHEFWNLFHHLWGLAHDGAAYDQPVKDQWGQLQNMAQRLGLRRFDPLEASVAPALKHFP